MQPTHPTADRQSEIRGTAAERPIELGAELIRAFGRQRTPFLTQLYAIGLPANVIDDWCGVEFIRRHGDDLYEPDDEGEPQLVVPIFDGEDLIDFVAVWGKGNWRRRTGAAIILGIDALYRPFGWAEPVAIYRSPVGWLYADGDGVVVLDWTAAAAMHLRSRRLLPEDLGHARELRRRLRIEADIVLPRESIAA